jgi:hypothetical protein
LSIVEGESYRITQGIKEKKENTQNKMSALYGTIKGTKGMATRCGHRELVTHSACWNGAVRVELQHDKKTNSTSYRVELVPWHGAGENRLLAEGVMGRMQND